jgi:hypothetical protein
MTDAGWLSRNGRGKGDCRESQSSSFGNSAILHPFNSPEAEGPQVDTMTSSVTLDETFFLSVSGYLD